MLLHIEGLLSKSDVAQCRQALAQAQWTDGRETVGPQGALVKHNKQLPIDSAVGRELGQVILQKLYQHPQFMAAALPLRTVPPLFNSYAGGELQVIDTYGAHEIKLPAGDLILYPSTSLHQVLPVTRGERVCSFFWTQSMVRDAFKRSMLFELDGHIQSLRQQVGDNAAVLGLTGHYHNLLRQWTEM